MSRAITVLREERSGPFTVQVYDFADTWLLDTPAPASWHGLVYRILDEAGVELSRIAIPRDIARLGARLVDSATDGNRLIAVPKERLL
jgi:hypothetical protein